MKKLSWVWLIAILAIIVSGCAPKTVYVVVGGDVGRVGIPDPPRLIMLPEDTGTARTLAISGVGTIDSSVTTGEYITAALWNTNFGNINTWISAIKGQKVIAAIDLAVDAVTTTEIADDAVQERIIVTNSTDYDTITENSFASRTALKFGAADTTSYNITLESGEVLFIFCTARLYYGGSYTAGVDGSSSNYATLSVNRDGADLSIRATLQWDPDNTPIVKTITFMEYDAPGAGTYTYSIMAHSNVVHASGVIVKSNIETLFLIDKGK